jgi:hypothetical protein
MLGTPLATMEQLRIFITVAEQLHVTRAAAALSLPLAPPFRRLKRASPLRYWGRLAGISN